MHALMQAHIAHSDTRIKKGEYMINQQRKFRSKKIINEKIDFQLA
jgi:hypothetical protein